MRTDRPSTADNHSGSQKRVERFVAKYVDSQAKAELLRILAFRPNQFHTLPEILALTRASSADIEQAIFSLRGLGLVQLKDSPRDTMIALSYNSPARRLASALWSYLKKADGPESEGASKAPQEIRDRSER